MIKLRQTIMLFAAGAFFALSPLPVASAPATVPVVHAPQAASQQANELEKSVSDWIIALSSEKGFEKWTAADWAILPLGPGTHSWLVALTADGGKDAGYLIVSQKSDGGYLLTEYGTGTYPLFSMQTLRQSLLQRELIDSSSTGSCLDKAERYLTGSLESFWKVECGGETYYFDAKSGGELPDLTNYLASAVKNNKTLTFSPALNPVESNAERPVVTDRLELPAIDPYDQPGWIKDKGQSGTKSDFDTAASRLKESEQSFIYTVKLYGSQALYPLAVTGYHTWSDGSQFLILDQDGPRYVRWPLPEGGSFH
ncbi:hypothetical protein [Gorillibacterium massiliense]|uniref:hypothetical protein n=1 Tax=Gorillibacterium massiliense TaxID=1280390 RepID=UPI0004B31E84|nr:hypothetical protein [Gorillibacterium massiliense]